MAEILSEASETPSVGHPGAPAASLSSVLLEDTAAVPFLSANPPDLPLLDALPFPDASLFISGSPPLTARITASHFLRESRCRIRVPRKRRQGEAY